jgi:hypothetical protein
VHQGTDCTLPKTVAGINAVVSISASFAMGFMLPFGYPGVAARLVDENRSVRVQQCAHIVDGAILFCVVPVVNLLQTGRVLAPLNIFVTSF